MKKSRENKLIWIPSEYEKILNYLEDQWKILYSKSFEEIVSDENLLYFIYFDSKEDITSIKAWKIQKKKQIKQPRKKWNWKYNPSLAEYLIYVQRYEMMDKAEILANPQKMRNIIEDGLRAILCNV